MPDKNDMNTAAPALPIEHVIDVTQGLGKALRGHVEADEAGLSRAAHLLAIPAVTKFASDYELTPSGPGKYRAEGRVYGAVSQTCVVSGEPVEQTIEESFISHFWPPEDAAQWWDNAGLEQIMDDIEIEPYEDGRIDIGGFVYEVFAAALDPYPRKSGARFTFDNPDKPDEAGSPFAVLKDLKT